ncbi:hypothetical protein F5Y16DRAFT_128616 [Xylariaceae sp. FL0255]|nr:hypothetical protein F5Y16DRAFT_128616 [Xylariaceae sp. FL0255]
MHSRAREPIAIVGSGCHFAGNVDSPLALWKLLRDPQDVRTVIRDDRFSAEGWYHPSGSYHGHSNVEKSYLISRDVRKFDAQFFNISPLEARSLDPQQSSLLETVYEAVEAAGLKVEDLRGSDTGVFVGTMSADMEASIMRDMQRVPVYTTTGTARSLIANRISYFFGWQGPSITVDTACSSSLVAVHMAVQALRARDCQVTVACGTNLILGPEQYVAMSKVKMLSPDSISRMWDEDANGYARGDGISVVVLKTLSKALADGDDIECIIRETGVNQDGSTSDGLTLPSSSSQKALIRSVYHRAGLDPSKHSDQPQYFEAHGTGTPAGDPIEAAGIHAAFFPNDSSTRPSQDPMYVGSVKTVIGHTEGSAGIAGILKTSLALKHACILPNLHFNKLSTSLKQFYENFEISTQIKPWPKIERGGPRRASVNSFGIGGTNAHAILESWSHVTNGTSVSGDNNELICFSPFVFSAGSQISLRNILTAYSTFLNENSALSLQDLAWTLRERRSVLQYRAAFSANSIDDLKSKILETLNQGSEVGTHVSVPSPGSKDGRRILGIFTGQGAQHTRMGAELIEKSAAARRIIRRLDLYLAELPEADRPTWSLESELLANPSRVGQSLISQPICTAIQILITDLLRVANISFNAVVGHSSGEIGAAYAAGYLTARDAIYIAYYRGIHLESAHNPQSPGIKGSMLAAGISMADASSICAEPIFAGRISVAASNSPSSVTISGDEDAIRELQKTLESEGKMNRLLRVDKAYHSSHIDPCLDAYLKSLSDLKIKPLNPPAHSCTWYSSVTCRPIGRKVAGLEGPYWAKNLRDPVLFSYAAKEAIEAEHFDVVLEIGAHPALQGPTRQIIHDVLSREIPSHGTISRNVSSIEALSNALGFLWTHLGAPSVDLDKYERFMTPSREHQQFHLLKGLPAYQWNHDKSYWNESRISRRMRLRSKIHPLLGHMCADTGPHQLVWRNLLRESEIDWLQDHQVQGQTIFPAAGYISTAIEASQVLVDTATIQLIDIEDFFIHQAVGFVHNSDDGIEVLISFNEITTAKDGHIKAKFTYSAALGSSPEDLTLVASADIDITVGKPSADLLQKRGSTPSHMVNVKPETYYQVMDSLGYGFRGRFASIQSISRRHEAATCFVKMSPQTEEEAHYGKPITLHPAELDSALQSVFLARSYPGDEQLSCLHLPQSCSLIRVNMLLARQMAGKHGFVSVDSYAEIPKAEANGFSAGLSIYPDSDGKAAVQVQGIVLMPVRERPVSHKDDRKVFYETHWIHSGPDGLLAASGDVAVGKYHTEILPTLVRIANFYLRRLVQGEYDDTSVSPSSPHLKHYLQYARDTISFLDRGENEWMKQEWLNDTLDDVIKAGEALPTMPDVPLMHIVGQQLPRALKGEVDMLEELRTSGFFEEYYASGFGLSESTRWAGRIVSQITDRYPHMKILEIGAGTGAATKGILAEVGPKFLSYTSTDLSMAFAETADTIFTKHRNEHLAECDMSFKVLDIEKDPIEQGYTNDEYDLLVAFGVLHATANLERTLGNIRKILRPGGFLVVVEPNNEIQPGGLPGFIFGTLPGWWLGIDEGRVISPLVSTPDWNKLLKATGFSGVDQTPQSNFETTLGYSLFVSQAVDAHMHHLRAPLATPPLEALIPDFFIVGGMSEHTSLLLNELSRFSEAFAARTHVYETLGDVDQCLIRPDSVVVSLTDLDKPVFQDITENEFLAVKSIFTTPKTMLWITTGRRGENPYSNMTVGFGRSAVNETSGLRLQFLDVETPASLNVCQIFEHVLRLYEISSSDSRVDQTLWSFEPEIVIDSHGRELLPRLRHISVLNDRYNSTRREIMRELDPRTAAIRLQKDGAKWVGTELPLGRLSATETKLQVIEINTTHTTKSAIRTRWGYGFLALGVERESQIKYLALVPSPASVLRIPLRLAHRCPVTQLSDSALLTLIASQLAVSGVLDSLWENPQATVVVHNAPMSITETMAMKASSKSVKVAFITDVREKKEQIDVSSIPSIELSPYISPHELKKMLPSKVSCFIGLTDTEAGHSWKNHSTILSCLPPHCRCETLATLFSPYGSESISSKSPSLANFLQQAIDDVTQHQQPGSVNATSVISAADLVDQGDLISDPLTIVDWTTTNSLSVPVTRLDTESLLFRADRTYWMVGLVSKLGTSLCDWMVTKGARTFVFTSRNPQIDEQWISHHGSNGVTIAILPGDITDQASLGAVKETIVKSLPPIAGVMNGAVLLQDVTISNMSFEQLTSTLAPKVQGSSILDRLFSDADGKALDFFIMFSSVTQVYGNPGQANYVAANAYMCALAAQRRLRGLAATAIDLGSVFGIGYLERGQGRALNLTMSKHFFMHLSEADFHQIIAEAIHCGQADGPSVLSTGLELVPADAADPPVWASNPRFAAFLLHETKEKGAGVSKDGAAVAVGSSITDMLKQCATRREVDAVVKAAFATRLRRALQLTMADDDQLMAMRSREVGIDSLVSVDIRAWCLKYFEVSLPVLKIMGNDKLSSLMEHISVSVPLGLVPNFKE